MTKTLTEKLHAGEFLISEGNGRISREVGEAAAGEIFVPGTVLALVTGKLEAVDSGNVGTTIGVAFGPVDASSDGPGGSVDTPGQVYIARDAEVDASLLAVPSGQRVAALAALVVKGIIPR